MGFINDFHMLFDRGRERLASIALIFFAVLIRGMMSIMKVIYPLTPSEAESPHCPNRGKQR